MFRQQQYRVSKSITAKTMGGDFLLNLNGFLRYRTGRMSSNFRFILYMAARPGHVICELFYFNLKTQMSRGNSNFSILEKRSPEVMAFTTISLFYFKLSS